MHRRKFSREYKLKTVRLVRERGVGVTQASRDLDVHENVLRKWVREYGSDPAPAFPGQGQMKPEQPEQLEIERLRKEVAKLKPERDILKNDHGLRSACARWKQAVLHFRTEGSCRLLIGGVQPR